MSTHHFARSAALADGGRAVVGAALTLGPLLLLETAPAVSWIFAALALLFVWFAVRTLLRHLSRVEISAAQIALQGPRSRTVRWQDLEDVRLAYFANRRGSEQRRQPGWLQLTLYGKPDGRLRIDSTLDGFEQVLAQVHRVVRARDLALEPVTAANFAALGLATGETAPERTAERPPDREIAWR